jgi:hypothetical protein
MLASYDWCGGELDPHNAVTNAEIQVMDVSGNKVKQSLSDTYIIQKIIGLH